MRYQPTHEPDPMDQAEKAFVAAVSERCWRAALQSVERMGRLSLSRAAATSFVADAFQRLVTEAPNETVAVIRSHISPSAFRLHIVPRFRTESLMLLSQSHLENATNRAKEGRFGSAHYHASAAIKIFPRSSDHELILAVGFASIAKVVGQTESQLVSAHPALEADPRAASPYHADRIATIVQQQSYHPFVLADLFERLYDAGCSSAALQSALQFAFQSAHWPSWRGFMELGFESPRIVRPTAGQLLQEKLALSDGARAHLQALVEGHRPTDALPDDDEVPF